MWGMEENRGSRAARGAREGLRLWSAVTRCCSVFLIVLHYQKITASPLFRSKEELRNRVERECRESVVRLYFRVAKGS